MTKDFVQDNLPGARSLAAKYLPHFTASLFVLAATVGAFTGGIWGVIGIAGSVVLFLATGFIDRRLPKPPRDVAMMAAAALGVMALSNLWSSQLVTSWRMFGQMATIFLPMMMFFSPQIQERATPAQLMRILVIAAGTGVMMLGVELYCGAPLLMVVQGYKTSLTQYNRGLSYLVILSMPIMAALWNAENRGPFWLFLVLLFAPTCFTESRAAKLALVTGLATVALAHILPVLTRRLLAASVVLLCAWPFAVQKFFLTYYGWLQFFPDSWRARMEIWDYLSYRIMERPWLGWGLGATHSLPFADPHGAQYHFTKNLPAPHPHNAIIQLWVEMGLPGLALGIGFALWVLGKASRLNPRLAPFAFGAWVAALSLSLSAYNLWTDATFAAFAMTGFVFATLEKKFKAGGDQP